MKNNLFITYIMPIRNESVFIERSINSILNQTFQSFDFEIIIADGMSTDGTRDVVKRLMESIAEIKLIDNPEKTVPTGFNRALSISRGDYIIRIDGHALLARDFLEKCLEQFRITNADCVGGPITNISRDKIGNIVSIALQSKFGVGGISFRERIKYGKYVGTLAFGAYNRQVFNKIGGYDTDLIRNQDDEFNFRMVQNKLKIWIHPSIQSFYYPKSSIVGLFKQYFQYGFYKIRVFQKRSAIASIRHIIPLIFIIAILFSIYVLLFKDVVFPIKSLSLMYVFTSIFFTINEIKNNTQIGFLFILLPLCFLTLHISYGLGSLLGIFYFFNKWNDVRLKDRYFEKNNFI